MRRKQRVDKGVKTKNKLIFLYCIEIIKGPIAAKLLEDIPLRRSYCCN